jgi:hypothetical protein
VRACLVNVGVNCRHGALRSPIFKNDEFEFVPIPEDKCFSRCCEIQKYKDMKNFTKIPFSEFIPEHRLESRVHNDPEFVTFTYGDYPDQKGRIQLSKLKPGDYIAFWARLVYFHNRKFGNADLYFIGALKITDIFRDSLDRFRFPTEVKFNAHVLRAHCMPKFRASYYREFTVFLGSKRSTRLDKAKPLTLEVTKRLGLTISANWNWTSEMHLIGSCLRAPTLLDRNDKVTELLDYLEL